MMSSQHIRETKIKHASPPSAGWLLSLGLKTVVTHEQSSQTKTCTLCELLKDGAYSKDTRRGAIISCVHISVFGLFDCLFSLICLFGFLLRARDSPHLLYLSPGTHLSYLLTLHKVQKALVFIIPAYKSSSFFAVCDTQTSKWGHWVRRSNQPRNPLLSKQICQSIKCAEQLPGCPVPKWQSCFIPWGPIALCLACVFPL